MRKPRVPTVAAAAKRSRQAATEQDSSTTSTSSTDGAAARPDKPAGHHLPAAGTQVEAMQSGDGEGGSRQGDEAGSRDLDGWIGTAMQEPSLAGVARGAAGAASEAPARAAFELVCGCSSGARQVNVPEFSRARARA